MKSKTATPKTKPQKFSTKEALLEQLIPQCENEYQELFRHAWSQHPLRLYKDDLQRSQLESDAWRVMTDMSKAAEAALNFFESRELNPARPDHGIYYAHELYKLLRK